MKTSRSEILGDPRRLLAEFSPDPSEPIHPVVQRAIFLARHFQRRARALQTPPERRQQAELDRLLREPRDKATMIQITDQAFRSHSSRRAVDQFVHILDVQGIPRFFGAFERTLLKGFQSFGGFLPGVAVPFARERMQKETANVILPAESKVLRGHLRERLEQGIRMNVNILGESILGEGEARRRLEHYLELLQWPETEVVSIKISTLYSQISALAREHTVTTLCDRLEMLFRSAAHLNFQRLDGTSVPKFVYLDMEEYRDMELTAEAFMRTLDRPGLEGIRAGLALQAYLPDSFAVQQRLHAWAQRRVEAGGAPVTLRIVKGANLEMERVDASLHGWPQAPFKTKRETDANFKRMVQEALRPDHVESVRVGIASHNLFEVAYAMVLASDLEIMDHVQIELLEGMANHQRRALGETHSNLLLYAPICRKEDFIHAIGYLIRRLDENTGPDNFLRHAFKLEEDSPEWGQLENAFVDSFASIESLPGAPRRRQNRSLPIRPSNPVERGWRHLINEPDTDFSLPHHEEWLWDLMQRWEKRQGEAGIEVPLIVGGDEVWEDRPVRECLDPSRPGVIVGRYRQGQAEDVDRAVQCAREDADGWRAMPPGHRFDLLGLVAREIRRARADLIGAALADGGKTIAESDPEVSEAVDFVEFYRAAALDVQERREWGAAGQGVAVVVSPWNFPIAIPCGGMAAALAAGNTVILKPASDTVLVAWELCQCFWRAGVSRRALQFLPCSGAREGTRLAGHPGVDLVILTGGTETARNLLRTKPDMNLLAETGGKNATIVTALADRDQAIKNVLHSAFSHSGQKCSATSLLLLEAELYEDPLFKEALCDAVESLPVGSAWDLATKVGPLIRPPSGDLGTGLKTLEPGESWGVMPRSLERNPCLWSPGVKWGVQPGSFTHLTELFGPVLGVMRFEKLEEAVSMVNQTGYGLTSGLESLDDREQEIWQRGLRAGNLYINRPTTGAIVLRQPFGGQGKSSFGPGIKAGGPNYVIQLMVFDENRQEEPSLTAIVDPGLVTLCQGLLTRLQAGGTPESSPETIDRLMTAIVSYEAAYREEFGVDHDHFRLLGQDNVRRYGAVRDLRIRVHSEDTLFEVFARACAAKVAGCRVILSIPPGRELPAVALLEALTESWAGDIEFVEEDEAQLVEVIRTRQTDRIRFASRSRVTNSIWAAAAEMGVCIVTSPVLGEGRVELLWYLQEQSLSANYHRYGNLGSRAGELRAEPE